MDLLRIKVLIIDLWLNGKEVNIFYRIPNTCNNNGLRVVKDDNDAKHLTSCISLSSDNSDDVEYEQHSVDNDMENVFEAGDSIGKDNPNDVNDMKTENDVSEEEVEKEVDMDVPVFKKSDLSLETIELKLSMIFEDVEVVRNSIKLYGLKHGRHM